MKGTKLFCINHNYSVKRIFFKNEQIYDPYFTKNEYVIIDNNSSHTYIINNSIKFFLEAFLLPIKYKKALRKFSKFTNSNQRQISGVFLSFFNSMVSNNILVESNQSKIELIQDKGILVDGYKNYQLLGRNEISTTYLATQTSTNNVHILKCFASDNFIAPKLYSKYIKLNKSSGFSKCLAYIQDSNCLVFEFCAGKKLSDLIKNKGLLINQKLQIVKQVLLAIQYLHSTGMVYGDIDVSNIIIDKNNNIKFIDLETLFDCDDNEYGISSGNVLCLTPENINTNVFKPINGLPNSFKTDIYQIGNLIYVLFYNQYPFSGFTWKELVGNIQKKQVCFPEILPGQNSCFYNLLQSFILKLMNKDLKDRPESIKEVINNWNDILKKINLYDKSKTL